MKKLVVVLYGPVLPGPLVGEMTDRRPDTAGTANMANNFMRKVLYAARI